MGMALSSGVLLVDLNTHRQSCSVPALPRSSRQPFHDAFALAVLIFQLLMQGLHPFSGTWIGQERRLPR